MWTGREFTYMADIPMSEAERVELAHAYVFKSICIRVNLYEC